MVLLTKKGRDLPDDAVRLSEEEALAHQKSVVEKWPSKYEVFFLKHAPNIAGMTTSFCASAILYYFKRVLNVDSKILLFTFFPAAVMPGYYSTRITEDLTNNILLMKQNCPVCQQVKYSLLQFACSLPFPIIYGAVTTAVYSIIIKSYPFPDSKKYPVEHWKEYWKLIKMGKGTFQFLGLIQAAMILLIPSMQARELMNIMQTIEIQEKFLDEADFVKA